ncbi:Peptidase S8, subtilisin-related domain-containing protein [Paramicrosporidium saccamoebae]|uniref:Peptidase S8, subtilisin-related domain-containing protein n=1 Tax=Paramicrosporidium saccamoebae TaxID=1246581 RepID=A0A2H9TIE2_9FUNG|nr:Peptidase S8, subtilisin-related domain-containing protein [Paramicrosporidium saccamoebae]
MLKDSRRQSGHTSMHWYMLAVLLLACVIPVVNVLPTGSNKATKDKVRGKMGLEIWNDGISSMHRAIKKVTGDEERINGPPLNSPAERPDDQSPYGSLNSTQSASQQESDKTTMFSEMSSSTTVQSSSETTSSSSSTELSKTSAMTSVTQSRPMQETSSILKATAEIKSSFVTQEALRVHDTSFSVLPDIQKLLGQGDFAGIFEKKLVNAAGDAMSMSSILNGTMSEQNLDENLYVEAVSFRKGKPFLYTGTTKLRTRRNCYIIKAKDDLDEGTRSKIKQVLVTLGGQIMYDYMAKGLHGFSVCFPTKQLPLSLLKSITPLAWMERDQFSSVEYVQEDAPWQLPRMNDPESPLVGSPYHFNATGKGVNVYTVDSGVMVDHPEFGGRAKLGFSIFGTGNFPNDCAGHGTQVASVIAGTNVGVAKLANIISCQVLDCEGQGENSSVLAALNWIIDNHVKPAVINMSVGGPKSPTVDAAVLAAVNRGVGVIVAAGNSMIDACTLSPSGVDAAMVVGASDADLARADFSNYGSCVDLFAPGRHVIAAALPSQSTKNGFTFVSGTSLSAPLVTGLYALLLEQNPEKSPAELKNAIVAASAIGFMKEKTLMGSPNVLAQAPAQTQNTDYAITYLPMGTLPVFGSPSSGPGTAEIGLIIAAAIIAVIFILGAIGVYLKRLRDKKRESDAAKFSSAFQ